MKLTLIYGELPEEMKRELAQLEIRMREVQQDRTFVAEYDSTDGPDIYNRPCGGFFDEVTHIANERYWPVVNGIKANYPEMFSFINTKRILFIEDIAWEMSDTTTHNSKWKVRLQRAPKATQAIFGCDYIIKTRKFYTDKMSESQEAAMIMAELMTIDKEKGSIYKPTSESYSVFTSTFGAKWLDEGAVNIPNVSEQHVELVGLPTADGQQSMFRVLEITQPTEE